MVQTLGELPRMGRIEDSQPVHDFGIFHRGRPGNASAPVVTDQLRGLSAAFLYEPADVSGQFVGLVGLDALRPR